MDLLNSSFVLYLMIGAGVGLAVYLADRAGTRTERCIRVATAVPFWPLYVPVLLRGAGPTSASNELEPLDDMAAAIAQVDRELQAALGSLRGWAESVLTREKVRFGELHSAWIAQAQRIREMDCFLSLPEHTTGTGNKGVIERLQQNEQARHRNLQRIQRLRDRAYNDLMGTLAWVRELVSMIHLAKFTGAPASRAEEIVAQMAAGVEGLSEVTWHEEEGFEKANTIVRLSGR
ncbi:MAG TPA: hypothetical protein VE988_13995 [Gemmataceae bacterium]|nr:hypothetical protein [Gemmataceae bacterium]